MARRAAETAEDLLALRGGGLPGRIVGNLLRRRRQARLVGDDSGDVAGRQLVGVAVVIEIVRPGPALAEALARLDAEMRVHGVDGELAQRGEDALLAERPDGQVGIDSVETAEIDEPVGHHRELAEIDALRRQRHRLRRAVLPRGGDRLVALGAEVAGHLAAEELDQPCPEQARRAALVGKLRVERVEVEALEALRDEGVGTEIPGRARDRHVVAGSAIVGIGTGGPPKRRIGRLLPLGRNDRLGRHRPPDAVGRGEMRREEMQALADQLLQLGRRERALKLGEIDVLGDRLFGPGRRVIGGRAPDRKKDRAQGGRDQNSLPSTSAAVAQHIHTRASV